MTAPTARRESLPNPPAARTILLDIDTQADFCDGDGALYVPGADSGPVRSAMGALVVAARAAGIPRVATADDHQASDAEISDAPDFAATFPAHCMRGTEGAMRVPETRLTAPLVLGDGAYDDARLAELVARHGEVLVLKQHVDAFTNPHFDRVLDLLAPERVIVFGVATDICVNAAVEGLVRRRARLGTALDIVVVDEACAALDAGREASCRAAWDTSLVRRVTTSEALAMMVQPTF